MDIDAYFEIKAKKSDREHQVIEEEYQLFIQKGGEVKKLKDGYAFGSISGDINTILDEFRNRLK